MIGSTELEQNLIAYKNNIGTFIVFINLIDYFLIKAFLN